MTSRCPPATASDRRMEPTTAEGTDPMPRIAARVLVVDDDHDTADLVRTVLALAGHAVTAIAERDPDAIRAAVVAARPDCVLLDGEAPGEYGASWSIAGWLAALPVPTIMCTGSERAAREARESASVRSRDARFAAVLLKPFELDELVRAVTAAVARPAAPDGA